MNNKSFKENTSKIEKRKWYYAHLKITIFFFTMMEKHYVHHLNNYM